MAALSIFNAAVDLFFKSKTMIPDISIVLVETTHAGNIGAAARAMKTMHFDDLRLVRPCKYKTAESLARASGADEIVTEARVFDTLEEALADRVRVFGTSARSRSLDWAPKALPEVAQSILSETHATAIVFGRERSGLTNEELALCDGRLLIPANPAFSSLNLASAVQIVTYELRRQVDFSYETQAASEVPVDAEQLANRDAIENMYTHLQQVAEQTGFLDPSNPRLLMQRFRRLFSRAGLLQTEVQIVRGLLTAVEKSLR